MGYDKPLSSEKELPSTLFCLGKRGWGCAGELVLAAMRLSIAGFWERRRTSVCFYALYLYIVLIRRDDKWQNRVNEEMMCVCGVRIAVVVNERVSETF